MSENVIVVRRPDGTEVEVTEGVKTLYDHVVGSMDRGSGFLSVEDAMEVVNIAKACGFPSYAEAEDQVIELRFQELWTTWRNSHRTAYENHPATEEVSSERYLSEYPRPIGAHYEHSCDQCKSVKANLRSEAARQVRAL